MDFLFVNPPAPRPEEQSGYGVAAPPIGIGYVAAVLREAGFSVAAIDLALHEDYKAEFERQLALHNPRVVGFYAVTITYYTTVGLLDVLRASGSDAIAWVGGPHMTYEIEDALINGGFDIAFLFEAEESAVEVAKVQLRGEGELDDVKGIAFLRDGKVVKTPSRAREKVLDSVPFPARDLFPMHVYPRPGNIMSSRGCPLKCIFCIASTFEDAYRYRSPENVMGEVRQLYETWGINDFYFVDNVFTTHRKRAREIAAMIRKSDLPIGWYCVSRVDYVSPVLMQELASSGCYRIELGVESSDLSVIDTMKKRITIEQVKRAADIILNLGMQPMFTFQVGHPDDTLDTIEATLNLMNEMRNIGAGTYLSITTPYPGTPLYVNREKYGIQLETSNWEDWCWSSPTYSTKNFSRNDLRKAVFRDAVNMLDAINKGKVKDPPSAPWIRFDPKHPPVKLPPPPKGPDKGPLKLGHRKPESPEKRVSLPLLQVERVEKQAEA
jgi:anaerobic magnesium-protoporphyrin IX monomethyl ester cyclase